ncbi:MULTISPECIES: response regulator transcription factor [Lacrimispora]|jgi:DNA-binding response OmpR family regulator|uniref:response regulator transcription factor n=1 Tax=Lacrimispora TaxID=2719231 RepID=UPI000BE2C72F|nr:response regulator transcription factor [Lacrimispora amygdalina]MDK2967434.1 two-component system, OmpR family, response regulator [Lacrimispora sp.]
MISGNILMVEDDPDIREGVRVLLGSEGYTVTEAESGNKALDMLNEEYDLIILDIMMPGISGIRTCEEIRKISNVPILFLTAKARESDKLLGLMAGGDDYLPKPFSYAELLGRVKALLRRYHVYQGKNHEKTEELSFVEWKGIRVSTAYNEVLIEGQNVELSEIEYQILKLLVQYPNKIFSAQNIYESVWKEPYFYGSNNTIMVHIRKLRLKIEKNPQEPKRICTVWGKGYRIG